MKAITQILWFGGLLCVSSVPESKAQVIVEPESVIDELCLRAAEKAGTACIDFNSTKGNHYPPGVLHGPGLLAATSNAGIDLVIETKDDVVVATAYSPVERVRNYALLENSIAEAIIRTNQKRINQLLVVYSAHDSSGVSQLILEDPDKAQTITVFSNEPFSNTVNPPIRTQLVSPQPNCHEDELVVDFEPVSTNLFASTLLVHIGASDGLLVLGMICVGYNIREIRQ